MTLGKENDKVRGDIPKKFPLKKPNIISKTNLNLKYGDVIYLKFFDDQGYKGIVAG